MRARFCLIVIALAGLAPLAPAGAAASFTVVATDFAWTPDFLQIEPGDSVTFARGGGTHTWVRDDGSDSCALPCTRTFSTPATVAYHCGVHPSMTGVVQVGPGLELSVSTPTEGATVSGLVRVEGAASHPSEPIASVTVRIGTGSVVPAQIVGDGTSVTWSADVDSTVLADGAHEILARASVESASREARVGVVVDNPDRIDLQITALSAPPSATTSSTITLVVRNGGNVPSGASVARAEYLYQGEWRAIGDVGVASLAAGTSRLATVRWAPETVLVGQFTLRATADPDALIADVDRSNNARLGSGGWFTSAVPGIDLLDPL